jgi:hypothetical protein
MGVEIDMVYVGWRIRHPDGDKTDGDGNKFYGWEDSYDEWLPLQSARLAPLHTHTDSSFKNMTSEAQTKKPEKETKAEDEAPPDESLDLVVTHHKGAEIFAVQRKACLSDLLIDFLNEFGRLGGFDKIMERVEAHEKGKEELILLSAYTECFAKSAPVMHRKFVDKYFKRFEAAAVKSMLEANEQQLRATRRERFDDMIESLFKFLLPRLADRSPHDLNRDKGMLQVKLGALFMSQPFLEKRIDGLKLVTDVSKNCLTILSAKES